MSIDQPIAPMGTRPRGRRKHHSSASSVVLRIIILVVAFTLLPLISAQDTTSTSSASSSVSSGRSTISSSQTTSSRISTSTSSSASSTPTSQTTKTYSISSLPTSVSLPSLNATTPLIQIVLPSTNLVYLTFSICTLTSNSTLLPTILLSTADPPSFDIGTKPISDASSGGTKAVGYNRKINKNGQSWKVALDRGFGNFSLNSTDEVPVNVLFGLGLHDDGVTLDEVDVSGRLVIQMDASEDGPLNSMSSALPYLGDTTSNQALIFSPLLYSYSEAEPSYPNYTLPSAQLPLVPINDLSPDSLVSGNTSLSENLTLYVVPTSSDNSPTTNQLEYSQCAISLAVNTTGSLAEKVIVRTEEPQWSTVDSLAGYRQYWVIGGLEAGTNYTTWLKDQNGVWSGPIWFNTKAASFPCQLVLPTSTCPSIAYSAPLPVNSSSASTPSGDLISETSPIQSLPDDLTSLLTTNLEAFSTSLSAQACGRDLYSHVSTCSDCFASYRDWLCHLLIPRCSDPSSDSGSGSDSEQTIDDTPIPAVIHRTPSQARNNGTDTYMPEYEFDELLPCLSVCNFVDRKCPVNMGFRCPRRRQNANESYAFVGQDAESGDGSVEGGLRSYDIYGGRWCSG
ncbi:uncharacterized protein I303_103741 [Kwoniella dejecticola CBS 10117]|uniref:Calcium channel n=1 Tax=Kwoniella dejecticola CBS 10117 TaxID=1296121 RepID=A0A1A6A7K4_9TREE|nr:uncharacterized protein I303_03758 [Kwoniella dejecticola CBS 10117]OBR86040.1 hypothetical protein I303_03758 [Kwoniella dejecticola CBS 10117]